MTTTGGKRAFIIHGWDGYPEEGWFPWLKAELEQRGFTVEIPSMPHPAEPISGSSGIKELPTALEAIEQYVN